MFVCVCVCGTIYIIHLFIRRNDQGKKGIEISAAKKNEMK